MQANNEFLILVGDMQDVLRHFPPNSVDSICTDPPYHLTSIVRRSQKSSLGVERYAAEHPSPFSLAASGFMGQAWDGGDIAFSTDTWRECLRVLKPGGHLLAFGGTRTYHRMTSAIEDATFEIRDSIAWMYGTGFPKSLNVGEGRGTALKPAHEPICVARKPLEGTVAESVVKWRTGALNIDACRISAENARQGRWPANVIVDEHAAYELDRQSGVTSSPSRFFYVAKPSRREREAGCEHLPEVRRTDGRASEHHVPNLRTTTRRNHHPTVKPVDLMRYLCRLVTPPNGIVLDPFMGSGSTGIGAALEGFRFIGIEREEEYVEIATSRIAAWVSGETSGCRTEIGDSGSLEHGSPTALLTKADEKGHGLRPQLRSTGNE